MARRSIDLRADSDHVRLEERRNSHKERARRLAMRGEWRKSEEREREGGREGEMKRRRKQKMARNHPTRKAKLNAIHFIAVRNNEIRDDAVSIKCAALFEYYDYAPHRSAMRIIAKRRTLTKKKAER